MTRVLCVRLSAMGDVVQSLGALQAMHAMRPRFEFCFVTQRENAPLLQGLAGLAHVIEHDRHGGLAAISHTRSRLRALRCDVALDFQGNLKSALCAWLSGARERIGAAGSARREPWSRALLTKTVAIAGPFHPAFVASCVARALVPDAPFLPGRLCATDDEVQAAADFVRAAGINPSAAFTVLLLGRPEDPRSLQHAAIRAELERDRPVLLLAGPSEHDVLAPEGVPMWRQTRGSSGCSLDLVHCLRGLAAVWSAQTRGQRMCSLPLGPQLQSCSGRRTPRLRPRRRRRSFSTPRRRHACRAANANVATRMGRFAWRSPARRGVRTQSRSAARRRAVGCRRC